jgi:hypothetical protein
MREISSLMRFLFPVAALTALAGCGTSTFGKRVEERVEERVVGPRAVVNLRVTAGLAGAEQSTVSSKLADTLNQEASALWSSWQKTFSLHDHSPPTEVQVHIQTAEGLAGRTAGTKIQLNQNLTRASLQSVFSHELAHVFLNQYLIRKCRSVLPPEIYSEAFAVWVSRDENRLLSGVSEFSYSSQARQFLRDRMKNEKLFHDPKASQALARLIAEARRQEPSGLKSLDGFFQRTMLNCDFSGDAVTEAVLGESRKVELSNETVLILDGISGEVLKRQGQVRDRMFPVASILKPALVAQFFELRKQRSSKDTLPWVCPDKNPGKVWTWSEAITFSCNGFFLDAEVPSKESVKSFASRLHRFGFSSPDEPSIQQMIGIQPGIEASLDSLLSLYGFLVEHAPDIFMALRQTPEFGTLSKLPDSNWFVRNKIALKSGTLRNARGEPEHGWIIAVGPDSVGPDSVGPDSVGPDSVGPAMGRGDEKRRPSFLALIHQQGASPQLLLARMRAHIQSVFQAKSEAVEDATTDSVAATPAVAKVQLLGLVPRASITAKCENLLILNGEDTNNFSELKLAGLTDGTKFRCDRGPLILSYPKSGGFIDRKYWGQIEISSPPVLDNQAPTARQGRARRGSEIVLTTSQRSYIAGVLASEFPNGRHEALKALAHVVKYNLIHAGVTRHEDRPICDTTHCQVFGTRNEDRGAGPGERLSKIAQEALRFNLKGDTGEPWLMYSIGGSQPWSQSVEVRSIEIELGLEQALYSITRLANESAIQIKMGHIGQGLIRKIECEKFRNALHLPSCPLSAELQEENAWTFKGVGSGHGSGLDLTKANRMAAEGRTSLEILRAYFPRYRLVY